MNNELAIEASGLAKSYGGVRVLGGIDLRAPRGSVFALLGPNGAGKTTTVRILATLSRADAGQARVAGFDVDRDRRQVRRHISLTGQFAALDAAQTGEENLRMIGRLAGLPRAAARRRAAELLEQFDLAPAAGRRVGTYSGGMRRRLDLAASLAGSPAVIFLDEPTTGLDPQSPADRVAGHRRPGRGRRDRVPHHAVSGRGRPAGGPDRGPERRPAGRDGHLRRAQTAGRRPAARPDLLERGGVRAGQVGARPPRGARWTAPRGPSVWPPTAARRRSARCWTRPTRAGTWWPASRCAAPPSTTSSSP